jgi:dTDP-4-dehydrorhamnose reductase
LRRAASGFEVHATSRSPRASAEWHALDLRDVEATVQLLEQLQPDFVVNAAYVMGGPELEAVTAVAPAHLARGPGRFVHVSTDVVFDGTSDGAYFEEAPTQPVHAYGLAKLASEQAVMAADPRALIVRTSLLYGHPGGGPPERQVADADFTFFDDEIRHPTHVDDLAVALLEWMQTAHAGPLHLVGATACSRYAFAQWLAPSVGRRAEEVLHRPQPAGCARPRCLRMGSRFAGLLAGVGERLG